ncbi:MAG: zinc finger CCCH domain-containing protein, partial [Deltaproteobacteria bacterium]|nr:zinc finger CCCH domain-containing protein [Deltaproteobacteria bacterium]
MKGLGGGYAGKGREVCRAHQQGGCRFGDRCRYIHEEPAAPAEIEREKKDENESGTKSERETTEKWEVESPVWSLFESQAAEEEEERSATNVSRFRSDLIEEALDDEEEVSFVGQKWEKPAVIPRSRRWVMDTGSPHDLIARDEVTGDDESTVTREFVLRTANGPAQVKTRVRSRIPGMNGAEARYLVLNQTPAVLSIGRRVMENGYDFVWRAGEQPQLSDADGHEFELQVINNVPYWVCDRDGQGVRSGELAVPGDPIAEEESEQDASTSHQASGQTVASSHPDAEERLEEPGVEEEVRAEPRSPHAPEGKEGEPEDYGLVPDDGEEKEKEREEEWMEWNPLSHLPEDEPEEGEPGEENGPEGETEKKED